MGSGQCDQCGTWPAYCENHQRYPTVFAYEAACKALHAWTERARIAEARLLKASEGYRLPPEVLDKYVCHLCGARGVKLWRGVHDDSKGWCAKCGTEQAGLPDDIDETGRREGEHGPSDQIYSLEQGANLLPWVPAPDGATWGYTSIPTEGCAWWHNLPTRL